MAGSASRRARGGVSTRRASDWALSWDCNDVWENVTEEFAAGVRTVTPAAIGGGRRGPVKPAVLKVRGRASAVQAANPATVRRARIWGPHTRWPATLPQHRPAGEGQAWGAAGARTRPSGTVSA